MSNWIDASKNPEENGFYNVVVEGLDYNSVYGMHFINGKRYLRKRPLNIERFPSGMNSHRLQNQTRIMDRTRRVKTGLP